MDDVTPIDSIIASSSSGITPSVIQSKCKHPERVVVGHPFNPPHIIPLVEVVGGTKTSPEAIQQAIAFYASIGKKPIHLKKELPGHVGKSAASRALQGDHVSDSERGAERGRRRRGGELWTGTSLGSDGTEFAMASWAVAPAASNISWII